MGQIFLLVTVSVCIAPQNCMELGLLSKQDVNDIKVLERNYRPIGSSANTVGTSSYQKNNKRFPKFPFHLLRTININLEFSLFFSELDIFFINN